MKNKMTQWGAGLLAALMLAGSLAGCATPDPEDPAQTTAGETTTDTNGTTAAEETKGINQILDEKLDELGEIDYGGKDFAVLYND